jgi:hypothetical protein
MVKFIIPMAKSQTAKKEEYVFSLKKNEGHSKLISTWVDFCPIAR